MYRKILALTVLTLSASAFAESDSDELLPYMSCYGALKNIQPGVDLEVRVGAEVESPTRLGGFYYEASLEKQDPRIGEPVREDDRRIERKVLLADAAYEPRNPAYRDMNRFTLKGGAQMSVLLPKQLGEDFTAKGYVQLYGQSQHGTIELECEVAAH